MTTLQGIIAKSIDNANKQFDSLGYITTNVANYNTVGYKSQRFENYLMENGRLEGALRTDCQTGVFMNTKRPLDLAIDGAGYFPVTGKDGTVSYTRDGSFTVSANGYIITGDGSIVGDGIHVPQNYKKLRIDGDGIVSVIEEVNAKPQILGKIPVVLFNNPEKLKSTEGNKFVATNESGAPTLDTDSKKIKQGSLEKSNVNIFSCVDEVLRMNGSLISSLRLIKIVDEFYRQSVNLRQ